MFCEYCEIEYPPGTERCSQCGHSAFVESLDEPSDELSLEPLGDGPRTSRQLAAYLPLLEGAKIPYIVQAGTAYAMHQGRHLTSEAGRDSWEAHLLIVSSRFVEAHDLWQTLAGSFKDDEEELEDESDEGSAADAAGY